MTAQIDSTALEANARVARTLALLDYDPSRDECYGEDLSDTAARARALGCSVSLMHHIESMEKQIADLIDLVAP